MDPAIKKVAILLAAALIVVIGLIVIVQGEAAKKPEVATVQSEPQNKVEVVAKTEETKAPTAHEPENEAKASQEDVTHEAQKTEIAQEDEMYEGALAGLSEEEIAKMALAEEEGTARTETTGIENPID